jgi:hypothetical protein
MLAVYEAARRRQLCADSGHSQDLDKPRGPTVTGQLSPAGDAANLLSNAGDLPLLDNPVQA